MADCDYCGRDFGNAGALAQHKQSCPERPETSRGEYDNDTAEVQQAEPAPTAEPAPQPQQNTQQAQPPATQQQTPQQAQPPANVDDQDVVGTGAQMGQLLAGAKSGDPGAKAEAKGKLLKAAAGMVASMGQRVAEDGVEKHQRAKQNAGKEMQPAQQYPTCGECGGQIAKVPEQGPFECPHCRTLLER